MDTMFSLWNRDEKLFQKSNSYLPSLRNSNLPW